MTTKQQFREIRDLAVGILQATSWMPLGVLPLGARPDELSGPMTKLANDSAKIADWNRQLMQCLSRETEEQFDISCVNRGVTRTLPELHCSAHAWAIIAARSWLRDFFYAMRSVGISFSPDGQDYSEVCETSREFWERVADKFATEDQSILTGICEAYKRERLETQIPGNAIQTIRSEAAAAILDAHDGLMEFDTSEFGEREWGVFEVMFEKGFSVEQPMTQDEIKQACMYGDHEDLTRTFRKLRNAGITESSRKLGGTYLTDAAVEFGKTRFAD